MGANCNLSMFRVTMQITPLTIINKLSNTDLCPCDIIFLRGVRIVRIMIRGKNRKQMWNMFWQVRIDADEREQTNIFTCIISHVYAWWSSFNLLNRKAWLETVYRFVHRYIRQHKLLPWDRIDDDLVSQEDQFESAFMFGHIPLDDVIIDTIFERRRLSFWMMMMMIWTSIPSMEDIDDDDWYNKDFSALIWKCLSRTTFVNRTWTFDELFQKIKFFSDRYTWSLALCSLVWRFENHDLPSHVNRILHHRWSFQTRHLTIDAWINFEDTVFHRVKSLF